MKLIFIESYRGMMFRAVAVDSVSDPIGIVFTYRPEWCPCDEFNVTTPAEFFDWMRAMGAPKDCVLVTTGDYHFLPELVGPNYVLAFGGVIRLLTFLTMVEVALSCVGKSTESWSGTAGALVESLRDSMLGAEAELTGRLNAAKDFLAEVLLQHTVPRL